MDNTDITRQLRHTIDVTSNNSNNNNTTRSRSISVSLSNMGGEVKHYKQVPEHVDGSPDKNFGYGYGKSERDALHSLMANIKYRYTPNTPTLCYNREIDRHYILTKSGNKKYVHVSKNNNMFKCYITL